MKGFFSMAIVLPIYSPIKNVHAFNGYNDAKCKFTFCLFKTCAQHCCFDSKVIHN